MQKRYAEFRARWLAGDRDRELCLRLMFLAWMHWADPPFVTGMAEDPKAIDLWRQTFAQLGGESSTDAEFLLVSAIMIRLFPWALGDEAEWEQRGLRIQSRAGELQPSGPEPGLFDDRGEYGAYFAHALGRGSLPE